MPQEVISAEAGALKAGADAVDAAYREIGRKLADVNEDIQGVAQVWTGPAHTAFNQLVTKWGEETDSLNKILTDLQDSLLGTEADRTANEDEVLATISGLTSMMNAS